MSAPLLQVEGLGKRFGGFVALSDIELEVAEETRAHAVHRITIEEISRFEQRIDHLCNQPEKSASEDGAHNRNNTSTPEAIAG